MLPQRGIFLRGRCCSASRQSAACPSCPRGPRRCRRATDGGREDGAHPFAGRLALATGRWPRASSRRARACSRNARQNQSPVGQRAVLEKVVECRDHRSIRCRRTGWTHVRHLVASQALKGGRQRKGRKAAMVLAGVEARTRTIKRKDGTEETREVSGRLRLEVVRAENAEWIGRFLEAHVEPGSTLRPPLQPPPEPRGRLSDPARARIRPRARAPRHDPQGRRPALLLRGRRGRGGSRLTVDQLPLLPHARSDVGGSRPGWQRRQLESSARS